MDLQDDRATRTRNRVLRKLQQRRVNPSDDLNHSQPVVERKHRDGGESLVRPSQDTAPEVGLVDAEEDQSLLIVQFLSSIAAPEVTELHARSSLIHLTFLEPAHTDIDLDLQELKYELLLSDKGRDAKYKTVFCGNTSEIPLMDLKPATEYYIKVCAVLTEELRGQPSRPVSFQTSPCEPDPPQPPKLMTKTKTSLSLKWNAACDNGSKITEYSLECDRGQDGRSFSEVYSGLQREFRVSNLEPSTGYLFRLAAANILGKSPFSEEVQFFTSGMVPSPPQPPMLSNPGTDALTISWAQRPSDDEFLLQMEDESTGHGFMTVFHGPNLTTVVQKLMRNTEYRFRLCAKNGEGQSKWSEVATFRTLPERPRPPSKPEVKGKVNPYSFHVTWEPPLDSGGAEITNYVLELDCGQGYHVVYEGAEKEKSLEHLSPGQTYYVHVACCSAGGRSDFSPACVVTTLPVVPGQCQPPKLQGKPKASSLHLRWGYPDYSGGAPVTHSSVVMLSPDSTTREVYRGHDRDCVVAGLLPGRRYLFRVRAHNKTGDGPWSEPLEVVSGAGAPEMPRAPQVTCRSAHSALITWEPPFNNGADITEYRLEGCQEEDTAEFSQLYVGPTLSFDVKGLSPATTYTFRVQAVNSAGVSPFSPTVSFLTPPSSPTPVTSIKVKAYAESALLTWPEPNCNGSNITSYNIVVNDRPAVSVGPVNEYLLEDLQSQTSYRIRVQAVNSLGAGAYSPAVKVTTAGLPPPPPQLECVLLAPTSIKLKWGERNPDLHSYTLEMEREDQSFQPVYTGTAHSHKVSRLAEITSYKFRIFASSEDGSGPYSDIYTFTTTKAPPPPLKAPRAHSITVNSCILDWQLAKPMSGDPVIYVLQLLCSGKSNGEYKQVYRGPHIQFQLDSMLPGTEYQARVAAVRICSDNTGSITGAFSPSVTFTTLREAVVRSGSLPYSGQEVKPAERKPWSDQQYALVILGLFVILAVVSAVICQQLISYLSMDSATPSLSSSSDSTTTVKIGQ